MMRKTTTEKAVIAYRILNAAKLGKMKDGDKFNLIKVMMKLKPVSVDYDNYIKDVAERLKPEGIEEIQAKLQRKEALEVEEHKIWDKYNSDVTKCVASELQKEVEFDFTPLSEEGFKGLLASNDFAVGDVMALYEVIGE